MTLRQPIFGSGTPTPPANRNIRLVTFGAGSKVIDIDDGIVEVDMSGGAFAMSYDPTDFDPGAPAITVVKTDGSDNQCLLEQPAVPGPVILGVLSDKNQSYDLTSLGSTVLVS